MIRRILFALILSLVSFAASAQICSSVPYTFVPGTTIYSGQINSNFSALMSCMNSNAATLGVNSDITSLTGLSGTSAILGTVTNNNASAGYIGEYVISDLPSGSAITLSNNTVTGITSVSLTAGDWDCQGNAQVTLNGAAALTWLIGYVGTSNTSFGANREINTFTSGSASGANQGAFGGPTPVVRFSLASTTTVYLGEQATFTAGTVKGFGIIRCRRVR